MCHSCPQNGAVSRKWATKHPAVLVVAPYEAPTRDGYPPNGGGPRARETHRPAMLVSHLVGRLRWISVPKKAQDHGQGRGGGLNA